MPDEAQSPLWDPRLKPRAGGLHDLSQGLSWAALGMLAVFALAMLDSILPSRLLDPAWQLAMVSALVDNGVIPLVALIVLHLAAWLNPRDDFSGALRDGASRLAVGVALGFLLLAPLQALNGLKVHHTLQRVEQQQRDQAEGRFRLLRQAVDQARSPAELQQNLLQLVGPSLPPLNPSSTLPELQRELRRLLTRNKTLTLQQLRQAQRRQASSRGSTGLLGAPVRGSLACLAYALAFAALAQRQSSEVSVLAELLLALPVMAPAGGKGHVLHASRVGVAPTSEKDPAAGDTTAAATKPDPQPEAAPTRTTRRAT